MQLFYMLALGLALFMEYIFPAIAIINIGLLILLKIENKSLNHQNWKMNTFLLFSLTFLLFRYDIVLKENSIYESFIASIALISLCVFYKFKCKYGAYIVLIGYIICNIFADMLKTEGLVYAKSNPAEYLDIALAINVFFIGLAVIIESIIKYKHKNIRR